MKHILISAVLAVAIVGCQQDKGMDSSKCGSDCKCSEMKKPDMKAAPSTMPSNMKMTMPATAPTA